MPTIPLFINSSAGNNVSADGSTFTVYFQPPLQIPSGVEPTLAVKQANIWYVFANIFTGVNDTIAVSFANVAGGAEQLITVDEGLYSLAALNTSIRFKLLELGLEGEEVFIDADNAAQKTIVTLAPSASSGAVTARFSSSNFNMKAFLGYTRSVDFTVASGTLGTRAEETAKFNNLSYVTINSTLISGIMDPSGRFASSVVAAVTPKDVQVGSQIVAEPFNPIRVPASSLAGQTVSYATFWIADQDGIKLDTRGEEWSARLVIDY